MQEFLIHNSAGWKATWSPRQHRGDQRRSNVKLSKFRETSLLLRLLPAKRVEDRILVTTRSLILKHLKRLEKCVDWLSMNSIDVWKDWDKFKESMSCHQDLLVFFHNDNKVSWLWKALTEAEKNDWLCLWTPLFSNSQPNQGDFERKILLCAKMLKNRKKWKKSECLETRKNGFRVKISKRVNVYFCEELLWRVHTWTKN